MEANNASSVSIWSYDGRSSRLDYFVVLLGTSVLGSIAGMILVQGGGSGYIFGLLLLPPIFWVSVCAGARRLHDLGQSGWWVLVSFVPVVNLILGLYLLFAPGQDRDNEFGPSAKKFTPDPTMPSPQSDRGAYIPQPADIRATSMAAVDSRNQTSVVIAKVEPMEAFWAQALRECESGDKREGLWAKAFADAAGDERLAKATYIRLRATQLQDQHSANEQVQKLARDQELISEQQRQKSQDADMAELQAKTNESKRAEALLPKGRCPACDAVIPLSSEQCPSCKALFTSEAKWRVKPLSKYEAIVQAAEDDKVLRATRTKDDEESAGSWLFILLGIFVLFGVLILLKS